MSKIAAMKSKARGLTSPSEDVRDIGLLIGRVEELESAMGDLERKLWSFISTKKRPTVSEIAELWTIARGVK